MYIVLVIMFSLLADVHLCYCGNCNRITYMNKIIVHSLSILFTLVCLHYIVYLLTMLYISYVLK